MPTKTYSPPEGNYPQQLPDYWRSPDKIIYINLNQLSDYELQELGWKGPIQTPPFEGISEYTHEIKWNSNTRSFDIRELSGQEKRSKVNYKIFWDSLLKGIAFSEERSENANGPVLYQGIAYKKMKQLAKQSLEINVALTEFIALIMDAKNGNANVDKIQETISEIMSLISFTDDEMMEINKAFVDGGLFTTYTL